MAKTMFARWLFALAVLGAFSTYAQPNTELPWADDFESYADQTPLMYGPNGWYADSPNVIVQTEVKDTGDKAVAIPIDTSLTNRFTGILVTNVWLTMRALPVLSRSDYPSLVDTNASSIVYVSSNGFFGTWGFIFV